ncbi:MAG TPA: GNAT family protein [Thermomicrobiales bacterium]|nr:GNAT family protein [Thermomicrobiales bacterium]
MKRNDGDATSGASHEPIINITGQRVALGPLRRDLIPLYARWRNDFTVQRTFGDPPRPVTEGQRAAWFEEQSNSAAEWFTIYGLNPFRPIGTTDLFNIDFRYSIAQFGMLIGEADARGRGLGTEVVRLMLDYAFTALGLNNVMLTVSEYNIAGRRAYERAGFREFGRRRQADSIGGQRYDEVYMDCLASEFVSPVLGRVFVPDIPRST